MKRDRLAQPRRFRRLLEQPAELARRRRLTINATGEQPALFRRNAGVTPGRPRLPPLPQQVEDLGRKPQGAAEGGVSEARPEPGEGDEGFGPRDADEAFTLKLYQSARLSCSASEADCRRVRPCAVFAQKWGWTARIEDRGPCGDRDEDAVGELAT